MVCGKWTATHRRDTWAECIINQETGRKKNWERKVGGLRSCLRQCRHLRGNNITHRNGNKMPLWLFLYARNQRQFLRQSVPRGGSDGSLLWDSEFTSYLNNGCRFTLWLTGFIITIIIIVTCLRNSRRIVKEEGAWQRAVRLMEHHRHRETERG